jgi:hypothetical protein
LGRTARWGGFHPGDHYRAFERPDYLQQLGIICLYLAGTLSLAANHLDIADDCCHVGPLRGEACA